MEVRIQPAHVQGLRILLWTVAQLQWESVMRNKLRAAGLLFAAILPFLSCGADAQIVYRVINLGNPNGGTLSQGTSDNQLGSIVGFSTFPNNSMHAELWRNGVAKDLGTLGGPNSSVAWPNRNSQGMIAGITDIDELQPLGETWSCALAVFLVADNHVCRGFVWRDNKMVALPTLGGDNGFATGINDRGQIVGWAEGTLHDPTCNEFTNTGQVLQFEAVMWSWNGSSYEAHALPAFPGDVDGVATGINQWGQVTGISGICDAAVGGGTAEHMVIWNRGHITRVLPTLGGAYWNTPMDINNLGDVAGFSDLPGDGPTIKQANFHAFFWSARPFTCNAKVVRGGSTCDLGALGTDTLSEALGMNDLGQVVGVSLQSNHAFIWQQGKMTDLNSMVAPGTTLVLTDAQEINDLGEITGIAFDPRMNTSVAFLAVPIR